MSIARFATIGCAKDAELNPRTKEWEEYCFIHDGLERELHLMEKFNRGYREAELLPCFKCGEKPKIVWFKRDGKIMFRVEHQCADGYTLPPGGSYATSKIHPTSEVSDDWLRVLWNERQRQLKTTADRAAQLGKI